MLKATGLSHSYLEKTELTFPDIHLASAENLLILGKSGTGKSTLLHLLGGLLSPTKGEINVSGTKITELGKSKLTKFRGKHIGFIFQKPHLINALSVAENLTLAQYFSGFNDNKRIKEILIENGLYAKKDKKPYHLSQGEQQRLAIARGILNEPRLILADEPTSALDDENAKIVVRLLVEQAQKYEANLVIATHDQRVKEVFPNKVTLS